MREDQQAGAAGLEKLATELDSADFEVRLVTRRRSVALPARPQPPREGAQREYLRWA
jgi:hypothetical protein